MIEYTYYVLGEKGKRLDGEEIKRILDSTKYTDRYKTSNPSKSVWEYKEGKINLVADNIGICLDISRNNKNGDHKTLKTMLESRGLKLNIM